ncbi:hypothetical protein HRR83_001706 [Exophiala dermatitidis]|uniref:Glutathione S-transferase n=2 Tax=Exophiala dermatitidis TaxID=5970 RepID=H6C5M8_EXODN|nr:glutathione S-transferase [Exophiala dermatitidis NIH/UT8656]KAJ4516377.1 hypothetical protein HRR73_004840 [Exophiala dermatitidis]EHY59024.1 glutathione S-transferase [Exophiala dermatitidis NIH/UT8656]KAJ4523182.1 hypothetical protein HRR75_001581 [Exophiala dermatitidis]KAJ4526512.1 hypothetical protein HRR74_001710 [Exophiala dermatitidis]KAJ4532241.1 hypothetical protein HRR76_007240 [Exophiala dermatitidis]
MQSNSELVPTLHHLNNSQSQRILWLLEELEIPYNLVLHKREESGPNKSRAPRELKATHPLGRAPQLETGDSRTIVESLVIARYLIETYDKDGRFKGDGAGADWIRDDELCNLASATISVPMNVEVVFSLLVQASPFFIRPLVSVIHKQLHKAFTGPELDLYLQYLNDQLGEADYFMGSSPGRADFIISWPVDVCVQNGFIDFARYPKLEAWYKRCHERPAWKRSIEKGNGYSLKFKI